MTSTTNPSKKTTIKDLESILELMERFSVTDLNIDGLIIGRPPVRPNTTFNVEDRPQDIEFHDEIDQQLYDMGKNLT